MLNAFLATGTALLLQLPPAASAVIIYTVSIPIENLQIPTNPAKDAEKWCREFRDLSSAYSHCIAAYWFLSAVEGYCQYSRFRHRAQQYYRQKKILCQPHIFPAHTTNIYSSVAKILSVLAVRAENS